MLWMSSNVLRVVSVVGVVKDDQGEEEKEKKTFRQRWASGTLSATRAKPDGPNRPKSNMTHNSRRHLPFLIGWKEETRGVTSLP